MVKVSIIMPVYNAEKFLEKSIYSILAQTYKKFELILVNDGSKDKSLEICNQLSDKDQRIKVFSQKNKGSSAARNLGLEYAEGDYIMFIDADDHIEPDMVMELVQYATSYNLDMVMCGLCIDYYDKNYRLVKSIQSKLRPRYIKGNKNIAENIIDLFENETINGPTCKLIKRSIITKNNIKMPIDIHLQEDLYFNVQVLSKLESILVIDKCYYHYNHFPVESVTTRYYPNKLEMLSKVHDLVIEYFRLRTKNPYLLSKIYFLQIKNIYAGLLNLFHPKCSKTKSEKINYIRHIVNLPENTHKISKAKKNGLKYKLLKYVLNTKNSHLIYYFSVILYFFKHYLKLRY